MILGLAQSRVISFFFVPRRTARVPIHGRTGNDKLRIGGRNAGDVRSCGCKFSDPQFVVVEERREVGVTEWP